jgi:hypothetical protein
MHEKIRYFWLYCFKKCNTHTITNEKTLGKSCGACACVGSLESAKLLIESWADVNEAWRKSSSMQGMMETSFSGTENW